MKLWQKIVYVALKLIGMDVEAEVKTNEGRIDMTAEAEGHCYVVEFKLDRSATAAIRRQRKDSHAHRPRVLEGQAHHRRLEDRGDVKSRIS